MRFIHNSLLNTSWLWQGGGFCKLYIFVVTSALLLSSVLLNYSWKGEYIFWDWMSHRKSTEVLWVPSVYKLNLHKWHFFVVVAVCFAITQGFKIKYCFNSLFWVHYIMVAVSQKQNKVAFTPMTNYIRGSLFIVKCKLYRVRVCT